MIKYDLHDSLIEKVNYFDDKKRLEIDIQLCNWRQPDYKASEPELLRMLMVFEGVKAFELSGKDYDFDSDEILDVIYLDDKTVKIVFLTEQDAGTLTVTAEKVNLIKV